MSQFQINIFLVGCTFLMGLNKMSQKKSMSSIETLRYCIEWQIGLLYLCSRWDAWLNINTIDNAENVWKHCLPFVFSTCYIGLIEFRPNILFSTKIGTLVCLIGVGYCLTLLVCN